MIMNIKEFLALYLIPPPLLLFAVVVAVLVACFIGLGAIEMLNVRFVR